MAADRTRAGLAFVALAGLIGAGVGAFWIGAGLNEVQITLLTMIVTQVASKVSAAFGYFFDGTAGKGGAGPADGEPKPLDERKSP